MNTLRTQQADFMLPLVLLAPSTSTFTWPPPRVPCYPAQLEGNIADEPTDHRSSFGRLERRHHVPGALDGEVGKPGPDVVLCDEARNLPVGKQPWSVV